MSAYDPFSHHYDRLFPVGEKQADFLHRRLEEAGAGRVLDAGCGTGRHLELLGEWGLDAAGLEPAAAMAAQARRRLAENSFDFPVVTCSLEEASDSITGSFDAALCLGNTLAHLVEPGALATGLVALHRLLVPGARLYTQTVNFDRVLARGSAEFPERDISDEEGGRLRFRRRYEFDAAPEQINFILELEGVGVDLVQRVALRPLLRADQTAALAEAGFAVSQAWGDWDERPWDDESPATILVSRRE